MKVAESDFYKVCDYVDGINKDITNGYYPSVDELKEKNIENDIRLFLPIIAYYGSNPFKRLGLEEADFDSYKELVKYCETLLSSIQLTEN